MRFAAIGEITLHYALEGLQAGIPLVFINSLGSDLRLWDKLVPHFAEYFPIIRYDKRGHGLSDCPPGPYSIRTHAGDLAALLEHVGVKETILIGISVGGMIALDYAASHPHQVRNLVLADTGARIGSALFWNERIQAVRDKGLDHMAETILARWFTPEFSDRHPADYRGYYNLLTRTPVAGYIATCEAIRDADLTASAGSVRAKTLVLCGANDISTPPDLGRELAGQLADARFELVEQAAHLPCVEQPGTMALKISRFLTGNDDA